MNSIDWNQMSELGLIERINKEILHPLGLAMCRTVETGKSEAVLIADDGEWQYGPGVVLKPILTKAEVQRKLDGFINDGK